MDKCVFKILMTSSNLERFASLFLSVLLTCYQEKKADKKK
jgi:hypothetical protein